uniref:Cytochrome c oxidase subunit 2 n=1 Tax=Paederus fuscipes TaxID=347427 RepID=A0A344H238_9COLE|nr:cytochrome c oxidase subunit II [Paederus fuscipes]
MATWQSLNLQDSNSPIMEEMMFFHDHALMILAMITVLVGYLMQAVLFTSLNNRFLSDGQELETIWTLIPGVVLLFIGFPSLYLLYMMEELNNPLVTVKCIGHQWYWSYEYSDFNHFEFDSYMIPADLMQQDSFRLLDVDNRMVLPFYTQIRSIITATDVLHSWTIPSISIKVDATPGRLNQASFMLTRTGLFFGQCSEICGANHSFMPIVLESIHPDYFIEWIMNK